MRHYRLLTTAACVFSLLTFSAYEGRAAEPGVVAEKPADGPSVKSDRGYMVPYEVTIPGTDVRFTMLPIPGGTYTIGSPAAEKGRKADEGPQATIEVEPFWMGKCEVSWGEYRPFMELYNEFKELQKLSRTLADFPTINLDGKTSEQIAALAARRDKAKKARAALSQQLADKQFANLKKLAEAKVSLVDGVTIPTPLHEPAYTFEFGGHARLPAVTMTPYAARQYTKWLSGLTGSFYRLPAETEWEYACRAGSTTAYHFGDDASQLGDYAWYVKNSDEKPHDVAQKKPNAWGLHDMHGNVAEWVIDEYQDDAYKRLASEKLLAVKIAWPTSACPRVLRGGTWDDEAAACRSAARNGDHDDEEWKVPDPNTPLSPWWFSEDPTRGIGFRIVRPLNAPKAADQNRYWKIYAEEVLEDVKTRVFVDDQGIVGPVMRELPGAMRELSEFKKLPKETK